MNKLISVIIPCYNSELTLDRTLSSICNQDYENLEIIIVDDGSKDNSLEIANKYARKDKRIVIYSKENGGVAKARNFGLSKSKGEYIMYLDSDDNYTSSSAISKMVELLEKENADQVICNFTHPCFEQYTPSRVFDFNSKKDFMEFYQDHFLHAVPWNKITKRECLTKPFLPRIIFEDVMYALANFLNIKKVVTTDEVLYNYYCAPKDSSKGPSIINSMYVGNFWENPKTIWYMQKGNKEIIDEYLKMYPNDWKEDMKYTRYFDYLFFDLFFMYTTKIDKENIDSICNKIFNDSLWLETMHNESKYGLKLKDYKYEDICKFIDLSYDAYNDIKDNKKNLSTLIVGSIILGYIFFDYSSDLNTIDFLARCMDDYKNQNSEEAKYCKKILEK